MQIGLSWKWLLQAKLSPYLPQDEIWSCTFLAACDSICHQNFPKEAFFDRVVSHFQEKVGGKSVLSGKYLALVVVAGLDKATISMHCYLVASRSLAEPRNRYLFRLYVVWMTNKMPSVISIMKKIVSKNYWLNYPSKVATPRISGYISRQISVCRNLLKSVGAQMKSSWKEWTRRT